MFLHLMATVIFGSRRSGAINGGVRGRSSMMLLHTTQ